MNLEPLPPTFGDTRRALHQIAFFAISPARHDAVGRMGLRPTPGGFGTPPFEGRVARVEGDHLIHEHPGGSDSTAVSTTRQAARFFGREYEAQWFPDFHDPLTPGDPDEPLTVDPTATAVLGEWLRFGFEVLDELRSVATTDDDPSETQIWPEHFDAAAELGSAEEGRRASYGFSPGDDGSAEPYLYVAPWNDFAADRYWNADSFRGARMGYGELSATADPVATAFEFLSQGHRLLND